MGLLEFIQVNKLVESENCQLRVTHITVGKWLSLYAEFAVIQRRSTDPPWLLYDYDLSDDMVDKVLLVDFRHIGRTHQDTIGSLLSKQRL